MTLTVNTYIFSNVYSNISWYMIGMRCTARVYRKRISNKVFFFMIQIEGVYHWEHTGQDTTHRTILCVYNFTPFLYSKSILETEQEKKRKYFFPLMISIWIRFISESKYWGAFFIIIINRMDYTIQLRHFACLYIWQFKYIKHFRYPNNIRHLCVSEFPVATTRSDLNCSISRQLSIEIPSDNIHL